jgi:hypothetical protein
MLGAGEARYLPDFRQDEQGGVMPYSRQRAEALSRWGRFGFLINGARGLLNLGVERVEDNEESPEGLLIDGSQVERG